MEQDVLCMPFPHKSPDVAVRAIDLALALALKEERRLRGVIECPAASEEQKFQALVDLASLSEVLIRGLAGTDELAS